MSEWKQIVGLRETTLVSGLNHAVFGGPDREANARKFACMSDRPRSR